MFTRAKDNPFAIEHVTGLSFRFDQGDWDSHLGRLQDLQYRAAVVGPQGSGKTTLLLQLEQELRDRLNKPVLYVRVPNEKAANRVATETVIQNCSDKLILLDSAEKLSWAQWAVVTNKCRRHGLIVAVHKRCRNVPTWIKTTTSKQLFWELLVELGYEHDLSFADAATVLTDHHGNIREALRQLYDRVANGNLPLPQPSPGLIENAS